MFVDCHQADIDTCDDWYTEMLVKSKLAIIEFAHCTSRIEAVVFIRHTSSGKTPVLPPRGCCPLPDPPRGPTQPPPCDSRGRNGHQQ